MPAWADDPELLATFRAEVEERLASLQSGLLQLEQHSSPRQVITGLFRDAHTVKGSARMLNLEGVLHVSHGIEDLLGALRDGRFPVRRDLVDLLLASCDGIHRALPGEGSLSDEALTPLVDALKRACGGEEPVTVPVLAAPVVVVPLQPVVEEQAAPRHDSVRVAASKVYDLLDAVGEADLGARRVEQTTGTLLALAAEQARWVNQLRKIDGLPPELGLALHRLGGTGDEMAGLVRGLRELVESHRGGMALVRDGAMGLAMVPVRRVFAALPRILRDVAQSTGKEVRIVMRGEDVELDKQVLDGVADALKHLIINAVDHGCEEAVTRVAAGKPAEAVVTVSARSVGGTVVIEVADDGAGVDEDAVREKACALGLITSDSALSGPPLLNLLFTPAFSTSDVVTETSGRGVGLDVVRDAVEELGGSVEVRSECGVGTSFILTLPITLGVLRCLIARVGDERYAVPVPGVVESISLRDAEVHTLAGATVVVRHGVSVPLLDLGATLGAARNTADSPRAALLVRHASGQVAWAVDRLEGESELVVKDLGSFLGRVRYVAGATIDGDGSVVCLLDLRELAEKAVGTTAPHQSAPAPRKSATAGSGLRKPRVLVVEDSVGVRELERVILEGAGYQVETAVDGLDGAARLRDDPADLVLSDIEMPGMDGFDLTRTIRRTKGWENVPVIIMTSRGEDAARQAGLDAGASAYLLKNEFDQEQLVQTVRRLVGR
jgi:chemotaxis protein histidine kinase CheA